MYALLGTARLNGFEPYAWLKDTLEKLPSYPVNRAHEMLPLARFVFTSMDILDTLRRAPSAELYRLYLAIGKMLDDSLRILEVRQRLHRGMAVSYIGDNPLGQFLKAPSSSSAIRKRSFRTA